jgi:DNA-binding transcriptional ArsR family regulator
MARLGSLLGDETRSEILLALMDGRAHTGGELTRLVGVTASTASEHLSKLLDAGLVSVEAQGRHRYFRLSGAEVAELLESLGASRAVMDDTRTRVPVAFTFARTCYDHLAGDLAVRMHDQLVADGHLSNDTHHLHVTDSGYLLLSRLGVDVDTIRRGRRPSALACLDWTERRNHLAGAAGASILTGMLERQWVVPGQKARSIRLTRTGRQMIAETFRLSL